MSEVGLEPALPTEADATLALAWRNDPVTRAMSFHQEVRDWEAFWADYLRWMSEAPGPVFAVSAGERVGFLRFAPAEDPGGRGRRCVEISINTAPEVRRRGFGLGSLWAAELMLARAGVGAIYAEVRTENAASRRLFEAAGYALLGEAVKSVEETGEAAAILRYLRALDG